MRGGDHGGGTTIRRVELTDAAARELRRRITGNYSTRYRKEEADAAASEIIERLTDGQLLLLTDDMRAALPWLEEIKRQCPSEQAQRGIDQLTAALWSAYAVRRLGDENQQ